MDRLYLFSLIFISLLPNTLQAASDSFCENYARLGVEHYNESLSLGCNFSGLRWNNDFDGQKNWCLTVSEPVANAETVARVSALSECKLKAANNTSDTSTMNTNATAPTNYNAVMALLQQMIDAAIADDVPKIKQVIAQGADIHREMDDNYGTALYAAIGAQSEKAVRFFVEQGVNPNRTSNGGVNPLSNLLKNDKINYRLLGYLLNHGSNPNSGGEASGDYGIPLKVAVEKSDKKAVQLLLEHGANANLHMDEPVLSRAVKSKDHALVSLLLQFGANPNTGNYGSGCKQVSNAESFKDFPYALANGDTKLQILLKQYGAKDLKLCIAEF